MIIILKYSNISIGIFIVGVWTVAVNDRLSCLLLILYFSQNKIINYYATK